MKRFEAAATAVTGACFLVGALALLTGTAFADDHTHTVALFKQASSVTCPASDRDRARELADAAFREGRFRLAGSCYLVAGDAARSNLAFLKEAAADSAATKRVLAQNAAQVKAQSEQWRQAFTEAWRHPR